MPFILVISTLFLQPSFLCGRYWYMLRISLFATVCSIFLLGCKKDKTINPQDNTPIYNYEGSNTSGTNQCFLLTGTLRDQLGNPIPEQVLYNSHPITYMKTNGEGKFQTIIVWRIGGKLPIPKPTSLTISSPRNGISSYYVDHTLDCSSLQHGDILNLDLTAEPMATVNIFAMDTSQTGGVIELFPPWSRLHNAPDIIYDPNASPSIGGKVSPGEINFRITRDNQTVFEGVKTVQAGETMDWKIKF